MICYWYPEPTYFFFAPDLPALLFYSHIPAAVIGLVVGVFLYINGRQYLLNKLLFAISICFGLLTLINLIAWTNIHSDFLLFLWSFYGILLGLISILCIYFIYVFLTKDDVSFKIKTIFAILLFPVFFFAPTDLNVSGFDLAWCDAFAYEGLIYKIYYTLLGVIAMIWIFVLLSKHYIVAEQRFKKQIILMGIGIELFLFLFFTIFFLATHLTSLGFFVDSRVEFFGFFGMTIFMVMMGVLIVKFKTFNVSAHLSQALVIALLILVGAQYTYASSSTSIILTTITFVLIAFAGYLLIKSVKVEIQQRKQIEKLANQLKRANKRLKELDQVKSEFVSIASHQLRSPLTSIRGYASMLVEGSYGKIPAKAAEALSRIAESSRFMALTVEDFLNVSRIEAGKMKYEYSDFNLKELTEKVADDVRQAALQKGLLLVFRSDCNSMCMVHADVGKVRQVLHNLIDNAMKYTPKGSITVVAHDDKKNKKAYVSIIDTGVGMERETKNSIFEKFVRAKNANQVNVTGAGLGLFVAKQMIEEMGGKITPKSDGAGKGSTFTIELPLVG